MTSDEFERFARSRQRSWAYGGSTQESPGQRYEREEAEREQRARQPERLYELKPIPVPGVDIEQQLRVLRGLRQRMAHIQPGQQYYFQGDRLNLYELGFAQEPPLLAGQACAVQQLGQSTLRGEPVILVKVNRVSHWIDCAYFADTVPLLTALTIK